jgi:hypothetical protein
MICTTLLPIQSFIHCVLQTLTTLSLDSNQIGGPGVQHLANALQKNKVTWLASFHVSSNYSFTIFTDTHRTWPQQESNWWQRSAASGKCTTRKRSNMTRTFLLPIQSFIHYFSQTLTILDLSGNQILDQGVEHLAKALEHNQVIRLAVPYLPFNH